MVNYQLGKIYKIVCDTTGLVYYGSTCENTLAKRLAKHVANYKLNEKGKRNSITSFQIIKNNNFNIVLVELCPGNSKDELPTRERIYIENNVCVNKKVPLRTGKEYYNDNKQEIREKHRVYNLEHKVERKIHKITEEELSRRNEILKEKRRAREKTEKRLNQRKKHYEDNKERLKQKQKDYYDKNKDVINTKRRETYLKVNNIM